jgi:hypothetical protein
MAELIPQAGSMIAATFDGRFPEATRPRVLSAPSDRTLLRLKGIESHLRNLAAMLEVVSIEQLRA